jgi:hypothetical protein
LRIENVDTNAVVLSVLAGISEAPLSDVTFDRVVVHVEPTRLTTRRIGTWRDIRHATDAIIDLQNAGNDTIVASPRTP